MKTTIALVALVLAQGCAVQAAPETTQSSASAPHAPATAVHTYTADEMVQVVVARDYWAAATGGFILVGGTLAPERPAFDLYGPEGRFFATAIARNMGRALGLAETPGRGIGSGVMRTELSDHGVSALEWQCLGQDDATAICEHYDCSNAPAFRLCVDVED